MRILVRVAGCFIGLSLAAAAGNAQDAPRVVVVPERPAVAGGTVTGTVLFGDTQHPARFTQVMLQPVTQGDDDRGARGFGGGGGAGRTGLDGTFTMSNVAPGDYYVVANAPGYISEHALLQAAFNAGAAPADLAAQIPTVHVSSSGGGPVTLVLQRGGTLAGRVQWEDGSPAAGIQMVVEPTVAAQALPEPLNSIRAFGALSATTDDRGAFRILGLPGGDYLVEAMINPGSTFAPQIGGGGRVNSMIRIYAPAAFRKADAKPVTVRAGDERSDLQLVLNLSTLRTVSGHVNSATAGVSVLSGRVSLADAADTTLSLTGSINASGDFAVPYVPPGNYTLTVQGSSQAGYAGGRRRGGNNGAALASSFAPATQTVSVGETDVTGLNINLTQ